MLYDKLNWRRKPGNVTALIFVSGGILIAKFYVY